MLKCDFGFAINDSWPSLRALLERLSPYWHCPVPETVELDFSRSKFLGPDAAALIMAAHLLGARRGHELTIRLPKVPEKLAAFCQFSGLTQAVEGGPPPQRDHPLSETVPVEQFEKCLVNQPDPLIALIKRHVELTVDSEDYLRSSMSDAMQNVEDHAKSPIGGVSAARFFSGSGEVRVAIVDLGRGILATLRDRYPDISTGAVALQNVIRGEYSSQSKPRNRGLGISNLALHVRRMAGQMTIVSGDSMAEIRADDKMARTEVLPFSFPGTGVFFTLRVS